MAEAKKKPVSKKESVSKKKPVSKKIASKTKDVATKSTPSVKSIDKPSTKSSPKPHVKTAPKIVAKPSAHFSKKSSPKLTGKNPYKVTVNSNIKPPLRDTSKDLPIKRKKPNTKDPINIPFEIGTYIFYPNEGLGCIIDIEYLELKGEVMPYFVISFPAQKMVNRIPVKNHKMVKIRKTISKQNAKNVLKKFENEPETIDLPWKDRLALYQTINEKGNSLEIAQMILSLYFRKQIKSTLSFQERQIFEFALVSLGNEIAIVLGITNEEALKEINTRLTNTYVQSVENQEGE